MIQVLMSRAAAVSLLVALSAMDPARTATQKPAQIGAAVMAFEKEWSAAVSRQDHVAYQRLSSPNLIVVNADGTRVGAVERLADVRSGKARPRPGQIDEYLNTRVFGDLALVSGRSTWQRPDNTMGQEYFLRAWERSR